MRVIALLLCAMLIASPIMASESRSLSKLQARLAKKGLVAPTIVAKGSPISGFEPSYSFIDEAPVGEEKIGQSIEGLNQKVASSEAKTENAKEKRVELNLSALKAGGEEVKEGAALETETAAKVEETKVDLKVQEAKEEEAKLTTALEAVKAAEVKLQADAETETAKAADVPAAAPAPAEAETESAASTNEASASEAAVAQEEAKVDSAEQQVSQQEAAVTQAVQDEEAVKDKLSSLENKVETEASEEPAPQAVEGQAGGFTQAPEVFVGPKNIPAQNTRSVMVMGDHEQNELKYNAVPTDPNLLTDAHELKQIHKGVEKTGEEINNIHTTVEEISKGPLVPSTDGTSMPDEVFPDENAMEQDADEEQ
jgi:hypothetical protein